MTKIVVIGTGNMAWHICRAAKMVEELQLLRVIGRNKRALKKFSALANTGSFKQVPMDADIYIIAVSDDVISSVSQQLNIKNKCIVHTSGAVSISVLPTNNRRGVFYPLQTLSMGKTVNFQEVPIFIEAEGKETRKMLQELASSLSNQVYEASSEQRKALHLTAVLVNNFTNHLYFIAYEILNQHSIPFQVLSPLMRETVEKAIQLGPYEAQTGPAKRNDSNTMAKHKALIKDTEVLELYSRFSKLIHRTHAQEL